MLFALFACAHGPADPPPAEAPKATAPATPSVPVVLGEADENGNPTVLDPGTTDPAALYAACRERVEGVGRDGECASAADCQPAGCSKEVCVSKTEASNTNTLCDVQPCFAVLDTCGCVDGRCTWSVKSGH